MLSYGILPTTGKVFISVTNQDKRGVIFIAKKLADLGFVLYATGGTAGVLARNGLSVRHVLKITEGRPNVADMIKNGEVDLIINTPSGNTRPLRPAQLTKPRRYVRCPHITTLSGASAAVNGIEVLQSGNLKVKALQDYHARKHNS